MIDFGFDKLALIGAVALIVIGPEKLPRVARLVGTFLGKAQRYVADVKAEVNRSIELEELQKMKSQFENAARDVEQSVQNEVRQASSEMEKSWKDGDPSSSEAASTSLGTLTEEGSSSSLDEAASPLAKEARSRKNREPALPVPVYEAPRKHWRIRRGAVPHWYKQRQGVRTHVQSGAARVARFRPPRSGSTT